MNDGRPDLPTADITALRTVVRDGWYNALKVAEAAPSSPFG